VRTYEDLIAYKKSYRLCIEVYRITKTFPIEEKFGIVSPMRRCAVSIPSNIAEGYRQGTNKHFANFLRMSLGSCSELGTKIAISKDLEYLEPEPYKRLYSLQQEVTRLLVGFIKSLSG